jgi:hypothetical protein
MQAAVVSSAQLLVYIIHYHDLYVSLSYSLTKLSLQYLTDVIFHDFITHI